MDVAPPDSLQVSDFVGALQPEYAELLLQYSDMSTFEGVTLETVLERIMYDHYRSF